MDLLRRLEASTYDHMDDNLFDGSVETWRFALASVLCFIVTMLAVAAGIGGGGLLVPIYAYILGLGPQLAVPVSKATIFGVAVGNVFFISRERHPTASRPLIDYGTAVFMQGGELLGVVIGVLLNLLLSELMVIILLVLVLGLNAYKTLKKGLQKWKAETAARLKATDPPPSTSTIDVVEVKVDAVAPKEPMPAVEAYPMCEYRIEASEEGTTDVIDASPAAAKSRPAKDEGQGEHESEAEDPAVGEGGGGGELERLLAEDGVQFPLGAWAALVGMSGFIILHSFVVAGYVLDGVDQCHAAYWPLYVTPLLFYGALMLHYARRNIARHRAKLAAGFPFAKGDIAWTPAAALRLCPAAVGAGVAAGLLGIGGGMILGPIFVALDFQPQVGTATTGFMILFTALGGTVKYLAVGKLPWQHLLWFGCIGALGGQAGQRVVKKVLVATGRPSIVVLLLGAIIGLAVVVMASMGIRAAALRADDGENLWLLDTTQFECDGGAHNETDS